jgi:quercetin dioxygenase-like cupin family protein
MDRYRWDDVPRVQVSPMVSRQVIHTPHVTLARITFQRGADAPLHRHAHEQVTNILSGKLELEVDGVKMTLGPGDVVCVPGDVLHAAEALEDTIVLDVFSPARSDWQ